METKPDTIHISTQTKEDISSTHADLYVTVRGASVIGGSQAMKKAREVSELVEALQKAGLPADKVFMEGMRFETSGNSLLKSSSAAYNLRLRCDDLEKVPALLDVISARKNAALDRIDWKYPEEEALERGLTAAVEQAKVRAGRIADALGVKLVGVYELNHSSYDDEPQPVMRAMMFKSEVADSGEPSLDMDIRHTKTIHVNVEIWFKVSRFQDL